MRRDLGSFDWRPRHDRPEPELKLPVTGFLRNLIEPFTSYGGKIGLALVVFEVLVVLAYAGAGIIK